MQRRGAQIVSALTLLHTSVCAGETEPRSLTLVYEVPEQCPDAATFERGVTARTDHVRFDANGKGAVRLRVDKVGVQYRGRLETMLDGRARVRTLENASCEEVVEALAFMTALSIDPAARAEMQPAAEPPPAAAPDPPQTRPATVEPTSPPSTSLPPQRPPTVPAESERTHGVHMTWGTEVGGEVGTGIGVSPMLGVYVSSPTLHFGASGSAPAVHLEVSGALSSSNTVSIRLARVRTWFFPVAFETGRLRVRPGVALGIGYIDATGTSAPEPHTARDTWAEALASLDARWMVGSHFYVGARGGVMVPLRDLAFLVDAQVVHRTAPAGLAASLSAGAAFP